MNTQKGFTLIELVVVIVILGILAATAIPKFVDLSTESGNASAAATAGAITAASTMNFAKYKGNSATCPGTGTPPCPATVIATGTTCAIVGGLVTPQLTAGSGGTGLHWVNAAATLACGNGSDPAGAATATCQVTYGASATTYPVTVACTS